MFDYNELSLPLNLKLCLVRTQKLKLGGKKQRKKQQCNSNKNYVVYYIDRINDIKNI